MPIDSHKSTNTPSIGTVNRMIPVQVYGQEVRTVLYEDNIVLEPPTNNRPRVTSLIQRTWSTLWGWSGSNLKRLVCDSVGRLLVSLGYGRTVASVYKLGSFGVPPYVTVVDLGRECFEVVIFADTNIIKVETALSVGGSNIVQVLEPKIVSLVLTVVGSYGKITVPCRYLTLTALGSGGAGNAFCFGYYNT